jgi:periplasmic divalent cation tolerance protein
MPGEIVVISACASAVEAETIARRLLETRVAACVNVVPGVRSLYWWRGAIEESQEWLLIIKSSRELFERLCAEVQAVHSYEVPELLAFPVEEGSPAYLQWLRGELRF